MAKLPNTEVKFPMILSELDYILRHIISRGIQAVDRFNKTFETYWNDEEFRIFEPTDEDNKRELKESLSAKVREESLYVFFDLKPYSHQKEILWDLMVEREEYDSYKNLVVAATGERVIIVMGAVNVMKPRVSGTLNKYILCIA